MSSNDWRIKNKDRWNAYCRDYRRNNPDKVKAWREAYESKNPDRVLELRKASYHRRTQKISNWNKTYYLKNRSRIILQKSKYERDRVSKDPSFKCRKMLRSRITECLKQHNVIKSKRTMELIGCDRAFLVQWIESKFDNGMTWENHGFRGWHIDHIRPCSSFDLSDLEQQNQCFHYTNLQPLWATQNRIKGNRIISYVAS